MTDRNDRPIRTITRGAPRRAPKPPQRLHAAHWMKVKIVKLCEVCGASFVAYRPVQKYCDHECVKVARCQRDRDRYAENLVESRAQARRYAREAYARRGDEIRAINREWQAAHRDNERERLRRWQEANRDKTREYCRRYYAKNRERLNAQRRRRRERSASKTCAPPHPS